MASEGFQKLLAGNRTSPKRRISPSATPPRNRPTAPVRLPQRPSPVKMFTPGPTTTLERSGLKVKIWRLPEGWTTWDVYEHFSTYGNLSRVEIFDQRKPDRDDAYMIFRPAPHSTAFLGNGNVNVSVCKGDRTQNLKVSVEPVDPGRFYKDLGARSSDTAPKLAEYAYMPLLRFGAGVMLSESQAALHFTASQTTELIVDNKYKRIECKFGYSGATFKVGLDFTQIASLHQRALEDGSSVLIIQMAMPALLFRKTFNVQDTHDKSVRFWNEWQTWYRQTGIYELLDPATAVTQLRSEGAVLDMGRWLTYHLVVDAETASSLIHVLKENNIVVSEDVPIHTTENVRSSEHWRWAAEDHSTALSAFASPLLDLQFEVRYQLEACLSTCALHECNITTAFLAKLAGLDPSRATKLLEKVADGKARYYNPMDIFRLQSQVSVVHRKVPVYCAMVRAAVVTPTTVYYAAPVLETSNRIIRRYKEHEDRFLRVKFTDERYKGKIMSDDGKSMNEVFTHVKRTMQNGIKIGNRHYDFLAFGNSQFRENGAYFFAPIGDLTTAHIRSKMGDFTKYSDVDRNVAKYASRLGQCFSTTRGMPIATSVMGIPDIEHNGFCFSDGVGKISPFLAQMIALELGLPNASVDYPSVFQFRLGGYKGVLAVDPSLRGGIQTRPSQQKFPAAYHGLEICRWSQYTSAYLNVQIILVLSALGVDDNVFVRKMKAAVRDVTMALTNEAKAIELLSRNIDFNRMTLALADMIYEGFMTAKEPFFMTCLKLWRSWTMKSLKEKARVPVEQGAFVFGCIDETGILSGHSDGEGYAPGDAHHGALPQVFLQIEDTNIKGRYRVIVGVCSLARNPSLHPGDIRVVEAIDVPALHHLKNCVVLPQRGDRDLANMCSGGDLDGDDYLVMWDPDLLPLERNHPPMDYTAPDPVRSDGPVTMDDVTSFFVMHMKNDAVGRIAIAHRVWADQQGSQGVKDQNCVELAQLHSKAVDYPKTGVPAQLPGHLKIKRYPHWMERTGRPSYHSGRVLGKLYDEVQRVPFFPDWDQPFDERILNAYPPDEGLMQDAREVKQLYDEAVRRIMSQYGIKNEFEVWTTFVLEHNNEENDYKFAEKLGETMWALKQYHQELCYEKAGTSKQVRDWSKMGPFIAAMYAVTANEVKAAVAATEQMVLRGGQHVPLGQMSFASMPFMSFPWLFPKELGNIAKGRTPGVSAHQHPNLPLRPVHHKKATPALMAGEELAPLPEVSTAEGTIHEGELLDVHATDNASAQPSPQEGDRSGVAPMAIPVAKSTQQEMQPPERSATLPLQIQEDVEVQAVDTPLSSSPVRLEKPGVLAEPEHNRGEDADEESEEEEQVTIDRTDKLSSLDALARLIGS